MANVNTAWTKNLKSAKDKSDFKDLLLNSKRVSNRLREIIAEMLASLEKESASKDAYNNPNWPYYQADLAGSKRTLKVIDDLFNFEDK